MLTRAQRKAAKIVLGVIEGSGTVLAGGAAMNEAKLIDRPTKDLDFFTNNLKANLIEISELATKALREAGMEVTIVRSGPQFVKLRVDAGRRNTFELDFGFDNFQWATVMGNLGPRLSDQELAVNKVLAAFGQTMPRDLMDLEALDTHFEWQDLFEKARDKDSGFDLEVLEEMIRHSMATPDMLWPTSSDPAHTRTFGEKLIREIVPHKIKKKAFQIEEMPDEENIERSSEELP